MQIERVLIVMALALALGACPKETDKSPPKTPATPAADAGAKKPATGDGAPKLPSVDEQYIADPPTMPSRVGVRRIFLRQPKVSLIRDPLWLPDGKTLVVVAKVAGVIGLWKLPADGSAPAEIFQPRPRFDPNAPKSARNRPNWFIGTPRAFPDGKHFIFDGSSPSPYDPNPNILGIASVEGGIIHAVEAKGAKAARTPDIHPDAETVVFAACDELRTGKLKGREDQVMESTVLFKLPKEKNAKDTVCTMHRPRFTRDGKHLVFEVIGRHVDPDLWDKYKIPQPLNEGDGLIEPWIMNTDGTGARRLVSDAAYEAIEGRLQSGGSKEPDGSPDGTLVAFSHGRSIAIVDGEGKNARVVATSNVAGDGNTAVQFSESDPSFSADSKKLVTASNILAENKMAPPGLSIIDLEAADPLRPTD
jgi:Tol biopolymer transport system component